MGSAELQRKMLATLNELAAIGRKNDQRRYRKLVGKCFVCDSSYQWSIRSPKFTWKKYFRVTDVKRGKVFGETFERAIIGENEPGLVTIKIEPYTYLYSSFSKDEKDGWRECSLSHYSKSFMEIRKEIQAIGKKQDAKKLRVAR
jgi:hypothetical protein